MDYFLKAAEGLLKDIARDYNLDHNELCLKYLQREKKVAVQKKKVGKETRPVCTGQTAKGEPCRVTCDPGNILCHLHMKKLQKAEVAAPPKEVKVPKVKKVKKGPAPEHDHNPGEVSMTCGLCESHGDSMNPGLPGQPYEVVGGDEMAARLKALIGDEDAEELEKEFANQEEVVEPVPDLDADTQPLEEDEDAVMAKLKGMLEEEDFEDE
jgi:hypothetical protein